MIIAKEGTLYPAGYGSRCRLLPGEREHSERKDLAAKINHQRQPEKIMRDGACVAAGTPVYRI